MSEDGAVGPQAGVRFNEYEMGRLPSLNQNNNTSSSRQSLPHTNTNTIVDEAQECLAQSLLMFLYADLRLLSATGRINTKFEFLCIDSDRVPRTTAAEMAQLAGNQLPRDIASMNDQCEGVSPGQIMAILIVELRKEVLAQRRRVKEQIKKQDKGTWTDWVPTLSSEDEDDEEESDDDDDAGVMNRITDRRNRKEFETDMHALIRSYNDMLAQDLKGIPEVKLEKMFTNPLRRLNTPQRNRQQWWLKPGQISQRFFSFDDLEHGASEQSRQNLDDEGGKRAPNSITKRLPAMFTGRQSPTTDTAQSESERALDGDINSDTNNCRVKTSQKLRPQLSQIQESKSEEDEIDESEKDVGGGEHDDIQKSTSETEQEQVSESEKGVEGDNGIHKSNSSETDTRGKMNQSKLSEIIESVRGMRASQRDSDLHSVRTDPGPGQSWNPELSATDRSTLMTPTNRKPSALMKPKQLTQQLTNYVEKYREDHVLHNKLIIPADDYETFAGAEDVGDKLVKRMSNLNLMAMSSIPKELTERNMSENELLDFMSRCIESRNIDSLDFMSGFFRDDTISQTMVKSKAQVVWMQDWFPIKDCVYAISVDKEKKRVLVIFRGATTRADWNHGFDAAMKKGHNPVKDDYPGKTNFLKIHRGFYTYLFRQRKDTFTRKYDEIANKVHEYGNKMIGSDFTVTVNGYSLGGALATLFGFYASTDDRLTQNGPVKIFSYGMPYVASHSFADAFRHQEKNRKVQHARFYNSNDIVAHIPFNVKPTKRGSSFVHVGLDVKLYTVPWKIFGYGRYPRFHYNRREHGLKAYWRALKMNSLLNTTFPWKIQTKHGLPELQQRIARATLIAEAANLSLTKNPFLRRTLDEAYEAMVYNKKEN